MLPGFSFSERDVSVHTKQTQSLRLLGSAHTRVFAGMAVPSLSTTVTFDKKAGIWTFPSSFYCGNRFSFTIQLALSHQFRGSIGIFVLFFLIMAIVSTSMPFCSTSWAGLKPCVKQHKIKGES